MPLRDWNFNIVTSKTLTLKHTKRFSAQCISHSLMELKVVLLEMTGAHGVVSVKYQQNTC